MHLASVKGYYLTDKSQVRGYLLRKLESLFSYVGGNYWPDAPRQPIQPGHVQTLHLRRQEDDGNAARVQLGDTTVCFVIHTYVCTSVRSPGRVICAVPSYARQDRPPLAAGRPAAWLENRFPTLRKGLHLEN